MWNRGIFNGNPCENAKMRRYTRDFWIFGNFRFCSMWGCFVSVCVDQGLFSVIFLHFLQKYRCVPKIGFSADFVFAFSFIFFRSIVVYLKSGYRLTCVWHFLIVCSCCIFLLSYCILISYLLIVSSCCMFLLYYCMSVQKEWTSTGFAVFRTKSFNFFACF